MTGIASKEKSIIIVDDNARVRRQLASIYKSLGLTILSEASHGVEALEKIRKYNPQYVSMDVIMPVMDGVECFRTLQESEEPKPTVFFVSHLCREPQFREALKEEVPPHFFVVKSDDEAELHKNVSDFILALKTADNASAASHESST